MFLRQYKTSKIKASSLWSMDTASIQRTRDTTSGSCALLQAKANKDLNERKLRGNRRKVRQRRVGEKGLQFRNL